MTKILIQNFPSKTILCQVALEGDEKNIASFQVGYDSRYEYKELLESGLSSFFTSLIIHDEIFLRLADFRVLLYTIGIADTLKLLDSKIIKVVIEPQTSAIWADDSASGTMRLGGVIPQIDQMQRFEKNISSLAGIDVKTKSLLIQYTDNAKIIISKEFYKLIDSDLNSDLLRGTFSTLGITTTSTNDVNPIDANKLLRVSAVTNSLMLQIELAIDSVVQDGFVKQYLEIKLGSLVPLARKDSISPFSKISSVKGIPDLFSLYKNRTITMEEIIACRNTFNGGLFRKWYSSTDYDEQKILQTLINKGAKQSQFMKFARFIYPNVLGLINPVAGVASSAIDSYIVNKFIEGWSPTLFLDDVYKRKIDQLITTADISEKRNQIVKRFGNIGQNDPCPCQSGKKFKNCHGK